ncbi:MAG TPA: exosortase/archaeosortase family protein [Paludibacter sp.]|nr:exosortase/archaeosortase family protein [Paludibacter sp.]
MLKTIFKLMKPPTLTFPEKLKPFKGVIWFAAILICSNYFWKYNITGDESSRIDSEVFLWGMDISAPFVWMARHVTHLTQIILNSLGMDLTLVPTNILRHPNGNSVQIIWACTGLKQAYIYFCIIAFYRGPWVKKLWYIPLGLLVIYAFNLFRISFIIGVVGQHPDWFHFMHLYLFKYTFYLIIFLMWVWWEEKISLTKNNP